MSSFGYEPDIARSIKIIEELKSSVLSDIAETYSQMAKSRMDIDEINKGLARLIIDAYLLGGKLGIDAEDIDKTIINQLKLENLKEDTKLQNEVKLLLDHFKK